MEITKEHTDVIGRGIYPDSKESCSYYIEFKNTPAVLFDIEMLAGVSWHYNAENPNESSFMKKMGDENVNIPLTSCSVHTQKGHIVALTCTTWNKNFCMGLARLPTDLECWQYIKSQLSPQDCALLDRKRLNQKKAAAEAAPPAAEAAPPAAEAAPPAAEAAPPAAEAAPPAAEAAPPAAEAAPPAAEAHVET